MNIKFMTVFLVLVWVKLMRVGPVKEKKHDGQE